VTFAITPIQRARAHQSCGVKGYVPTDVYRPTSLRAPYESFEARASSRALRPALWRHDRSAEPAFWAAR